jgi:hypothetical protein
MTSIPSASFGLWGVAARCWPGVAMAVAMLVAAVGGAWAASRHSGPAPRSSQFARASSASASLASWREMRGSSHFRSIGRLERRRAFSQHHRDLRLISRRQREHRPHGQVVTGTRDLQSVPHRFERVAEGRSLPPPVPRQILVFLDERQPRDLGAQLAKAYGLRRMGTAPVSLLNARAELMRVTGRHSQPSVLAALQRDPRVRLAQPNHRYLHTGAVGQRYGQARDPATPPRPTSPAAPFPQYGPRNMALRAAHRLALGRNVPIAIIDSAVDTTHPELRGAVERSFNAAGREDAVPDFHGTAIAGLLRAHGLIESAAPEARLFAVRAFRINGGAAAETTTHTLLTAVDWALANGAKILNMSIIGSHDPALQQLLRAAHEKGVVVVAAAGNGGPSAPPVYPAAYPGVIAVTAVDEVDHLYEYANRGSYITVAAPGVDILAPVEHGGYAYVSGTSFAAAYVSGIAALLLERDPALDPNAIAALIAAGAEHLGEAGHDADFGVGRVNAYRSLTLVGSAVASQRSD